MRITKTYVEDRFIAMMLDYNGVHDFWCLPMWMWSPYSFHIRIHVETVQGGRPTWVCQISIKGNGTVEQQNVWYNAETGLELIQDIIQKTIDTNDKRRNRK